jgi:predicted DNA-binding transcriptional regulator AlpA
VTPHVELEDLVTGADIGRRLSLSTQRVHQLAEALDFPQPLGRVGKAIVWRWADVERWALSRQGQPRTSGQLRQGVLTQVSVDRRFVTDEARPGVVNVEHLDGESDGAAIAWAGTPIIELRPHESGVTVVTHRMEGEISKNTKGNWTLASARERPAATAGGSRTLHSRA